MRVGLISDTHKKGVFGKLSCYYPRTRQDYDSAASTSEDCVTSADKALHHIFSDVALILHAGDVGHNGGHEGIIILLIFYGS